MLISPRFKRLAVSIVVGCAFVTAVLGTHYADTYRAGRIDRTLDRRIKLRLAGHHHLLRDLVALGDPGTIAVLCLGIAAICIAQRRWRAAVLALIAPPIAGGLTEIVLKPLIGRHIGHSFSFPSGHSTGAFAVAATAALVLLQHGSKRMHLSVRVALAAVSLLLAGGVAAALVGLGVHYTTDTIGGFCVALGVVIGLALLIDAVADRRLQLPAISRKRW
jgi:undecaprenyl-diphosphatase